MKGLKKTTKTNKQCKSQIIKTVIKRSSELIWGLESESYRSYERVMTSNCLFLEDKSTCFGEGNNKRMFKLNAYQVNCFLTFSRLLLSISFLWLIISSITKSNQKPAKTKFQSIHEQKHYQYTCRLWYRYSFFNWLVVNASSTTTMQKSAFA